MLHKRRKHSTTRHATASVKQHSVTAHLEHELQQLQRQQLQGVPLKAHSHQPGQVPPIICPKHHRQQDCLRSAAAPITAGTTIVATHCCSCSCWRRRRRWGSNRAIRGWHLLLLLVVGVAVAAGWRWRRRRCSCCLFNPAVQQLRVDHRLQQQRHLFCPNRQAGIPCCLAAVAAVAGAPSTAAPAVAAQLPHSFD